jgi:hypothetical protein
MNNIVEDAKRGLALRPGLQLERCAFIRSDSCGMPHAVCALTAAYLAHHEGHYPTKCQPWFDDRPTQVINWARNHYRVRGGFVLGFVDGFDGRDVMDDLESYLEGHRAGRVALQELLPAEAAEVLHG